MATFAPPTRLEVPPAFPKGSREWNANKLGNRLMRFYGTGPAGRNVYIIDGVATETDPTTSYNADGTIDTEAWDRVTRVFWGGHKAEEVTAEERTILETAGYEVQE